MADATVRLSSTQSLHLIELYHGHDALWNICSPQYKDRSVRNVAYISVQLCLEEATTIKLSGWHTGSERSVKFAIVCCGQLQRQ